MDKKEFSVLAEMRKNSRAHFTEIGRRTKTALTTVFEIYQGIKAIRKNTVIPDFAKLGFPIRVFIAVSARESKKEELARFIEHNPGINTAFKAYDGVDFFIEAIFSDFEKMHCFMEEIDACLKSRKVFYAVGTLKTEGMLAVKEEYKLVEGNFDGGD